MHPNHRIVRLLITASAVFGLACGPTTISSLDVAADRPDGTVADGTAVVKITATAKDKDGKPVKGVYVQLYVDGAGARWDPGTVGATGEDGTFSASVSSTIAGARKVVARWLPADSKIDAITATTTVGFVSGGGVRAGSTMKADPTRAAADAAKHISVEVVVKDARGNLAPGAAVSFTSSVASDTFEPASATTDAAGRASTTFGGTVAGAHTITATLPDGGTLTALVTLDPTAPDATKSTFTAGDAAIADDHSTVVVTATARDANGNLIAGAPVTFATDPDDETITPRSALTGLTDTDGSATARFAARRVGTHTVTATIGTTPAKRVDLTFVPGDVSPTATRISAAPAEVPADGTTTVSVALELRDMFGNPVPATPVTFSSTPFAVDVVHADTTTDASGNALATVKTTTAGLATLTYTAGGETFSTDVRFVPLALSATVSTLAVAPASVVADGVSTVVALLRLTDANGNVLAGLAFTADTGEATDAITAPATTGADGQARVEIRATKAGPRTLTLRAADASLTAAFVVVPGVPDASKSTLALPQTRAGEDAHVVVTARDARGNVVPATSVSLTFTQQGQVAREPISGLTEEDGTFEALVRFESPTLVDVHADVGPIALTGRLAFVPGPPANGSVTLLPDAGTAVDAGGARVGVRLVDSSGFPVTNWPVRLEITTGTRVGVEPAFVTRTDGLGEAYWVLQSSTTQTVAVAFDPDGDSVETLTGNVTFVSGAAVPSATQITVPTATSADLGVFGITWIVFDVLGNRAVGVPVRPVLDGVTQATTLTSNSSGGVQWNYATHVPGTHTLALDFGTETGGAGSITIVPGAPSAATSTLVASAGLPLRSAGPDSVTLLATLRDQFGNPIPDASVVFAPSPATATVTPATATTDAAGNASVALTSTAKGSVTVTLSKGATVATFTTNAVAGPVDPSKTIVAAAPSAQPVAGGAFSQRITLRDANANLVDGVQVRATTSRGNVTVVTNPLTTDTTGRATFSFNSTVTGSVRTTFADATTGTTYGTADAEYVPAAPDTAASSFSANRTVGTADGLDRINLSVVVRDTYGNVVPNTQVDFPLVTNLLFTQPLFVTDATGAASGSVVASRAAFYGVRARAGGSTIVGPTLTLDFGPTPPDQPVAGRTVQPAVNCRTRMSPGDIGTLSSPLVVDDANVIHLVVACDPATTLHWITSTDGGRTLNASIPFGPTTVGSVALVPSGRWKALAFVTNMATGNVQAYELDAAARTANQVSLATLGVNIAGGIGAVRLSATRVQVTVQATSSVVVVMEYTLPGPSLIRATGVTTNALEAGPARSLVLSDGLGAAVLGSGPTSRNVAAYWQVATGGAPTGSNTALVANASRVDAAAAGGILGIVNGTTLLRYGVGSSSAPFPTPVSFGGLSSPDLSRAIAASPRGALFVAGATSLGRFFIHRLPATIDAGTVLTTVELANDAASGVSLGATPSDLHVAYAYTSSNGYVRFGIAGF